MIEFGKELKYEYITKKWDNMSFCQHFDTILDEWLNQFDLKNKNLILELLEHFFYYTENIIKKQIIELNNKFKNHQMINMEETIYVPVYKKYGVAYSNIYCALYWFYNALYDYFENNIDDLLINEQIPKVLVIIDDFSGSGETLIKTLKHFADINIEIKRTKIFFLVLHITTDACMNIKKYAIENEFNLEIIFLHKTDKTFKENYIYREYDCKNKKDSYIELCKEKNVIESNILGNYDTESLVSFEYNTPNNTLGLFWHKDDNFNSLFSRHKKYNPTLKKMRNQALLNERIKKHGTALKEIHEKQLNYFIVYCVIMADNLSLDKAKEIFGLTQKKLDDYLNEMIKKDYIAIQDGKICASDNLKKYLLKYKLAEFKLIYNDLLEDKKIQLNEVKYIPKEFEKRFSGYRKLKEQKNEDIV